MPNTLSPDQIFILMKKRNFRRKLINMIICSIIVFLGVTATIYKVRYEGGFITCFRENDCVCHRPDFPDKRSDDHSEHL